MQPESPTHPDAPRADGETPDIAPILATVPAEDLALVEHLERCTHMHVTSTEYDQVNAWADRRNRARVLLLRRMASLLARHRDGERDTERLDWLEASDTRYPVARGVSGWSTVTEEWSEERGGIVTVMHEAQTARAAIDAAMSSAGPEK